MHDRNPTLFSFSGMITLQLASRAARTALCNGLHFPQSHNIEKRSRAVKITKFLLLAVKNLLIFTSISCPQPSFVASSSQNCRKSGILRISIDRSVKGDSLRANSKSRPQIRLSLGDESPHDEFMRSKASLPLHLRGRRSFDSKNFGFMPAPMEWFVISMFWEVFFVPFQTTRNLLRPFEKFCNDSIVVTLFYVEKTVFFSQTKRFNPESLLSRKNVAFHWAKPQIISSCAYRKGVGRLKRSRRQGI